MRGRGLVASRGGMEACCQGPREREGGGKERGSGHWERGFGERELGTGVAPHEWNVEPSGAGAEERWRRTTRLGCSCLALASAFWGSGGCSRLWYWDWMTLSRQVRTHSRPAQRYAPLTSRAQRERFPIPRVLYAESGTLHTVSNHAAACERRNSAACQGWRPTSWIWAAEVR